MLSIIVVCYNNDIFCRQLNPMLDINVTTLQANLIWQNRDANLKAFSQKLSKINGPTDIIVLPEMFTSGFSMNPSSLAEDMDGPTMDWLAKQADTYDAIVTGSLIIKERSNYYNRLIWMHPGGMYHTYDKKHLFAMAGEHNHYTPGEERVIITHKGWRICPMICYDLRFPVWARNDDSYDLLIYVANWPDKRSYDWNTLLKARAIENQAYVVGVNRVGQDDNGHSYNGDTCVIDPGWKKTLYHAEKDEAVHTTTLSGSHLQEVRSKLPFLKDQNKFITL